MTNESKRVFIDKQHREVFMGYTEVSKRVQQAAAQAGLDARLVELVCLRVSQINRCAYCLNAHNKKAIAAGETAQRLAVLAAWRDTALFDERERAALTLAESVTRLPDHRTQEADYAEAQAVLSDDEISAVAWISITMNAFNRVSILSQHPVQKAAAG